MNELNPQQLAAVEAKGEVFVSAGAGTGKTSVLVERFVRAACDEQLDVDSILVITYTRSAASELKGRIREALAERGRHDLARALDGAWISTIHSFCARLLRAHPFAAGIDPRFRELAEEQGAIIRAEAFERALTQFCATHDEERLRLLATYGSARLRKMLTGVYDTLRSAALPLVLELGEPWDLRGRLEEFWAAAQTLASDPDATEKQVEAAQAALDLPSLPEVLVDLGELAASGARAAAYNEARKAVEQAALEIAATRDKALLQQLLDLYAAEYAAAKARESALDFEDLQLLARDVMRDNQQIREAEQWRFRSIMVDEFQDTNALQCELIDLLAGGKPPPDLFFVGDEFQSIYGFRHADVQVFRDRREAASQRLPLTLNYRSRPEVLAAVNHLFEPEFGDSYQPLSASGEFPDPVFGHPVELLVTDKPSFEGTGVHWRRAEARHLAQRVRELVDSGAAAPKDIALLFAAGTNAEWYEEELRALGLPTYRSLGGGYFGQQQVVDLLRYLRLLHNRYDDEALATVLASPFVGISNDALVLIRRAAPRRPLFTGIERSLPETLDDDDRRLLQAFRQRYDRLVAISARVSLERLCEQIVTEHDYDLAVLARWDGQRRYANLRKLMRLARGYEAARGRDLEGFVRFMHDQQALGTTALEAVSEEEDADAVQLLTIHRAKGREFKVVVVADAGRESNRAPQADEILALSDGRFGFKVVHPTSGKQVPVFDYEAVADADKEANRIERLRLFYVAMTRAQDRLIISGAAADDNDRTPIGWVLAKLGCHEEIAAATEPFELQRGDAAFLVRVDRAGAVPAPVPVVAPAEPVVADGVPQLSLFDEIPTGAPEGAVQIARGYRLPDQAPIAEPPLHRPRRLSFTAISLFDRCSYRYFAERVAGLREGRGQGGDGGMNAIEVGNAVHQLLELLDLSAPRVPDDLGVIGEWYPSATEANLARIRGFVQAYCDSALAVRLAALSSPKAEHPFVFEHDGVLINGEIDVLHRDGRSALVVDYKTNALGEKSPDELVESGYRLQRLVYALACFRAGAEEVEVVYAFLEQPDALASASFTLADVAALEAELSEAIARINAGEFAPSPSDFNCLGCPALDVVCAGPRLRDGWAADRETVGSPV